MTAGLSRPLICLVTDRHRVIPAGAESVLRLVGRAAAAGVDIIHVREPGLDDRQLARLVTAAAARAGALGARVLWGRCHEADVAPAYWPWISVLRALDRAELPPLTFLDLDLAQVERAAAQHAEGVAP